MIRSALLIIALLLTAMASGSCKASSRPAQATAIKKLPGTEQIRLPGPSSIRPDGSVRNRRINKPNGYLLLTISEEAVDQHHVDQWARNQILQAAASNQLGVDEVEGWILIDGPHLLQTDDGLTTRLYDITLEVWKCAATPRRRQRDIY